MRGDQQAQGAAGQSNSNANAFFANANGLYSHLAPQLESQAANPQGISPSDQSLMRTEAEQTAGGTQAGAVGQGGLLAARTRNAGAPAKAIADAARSSGQQLNEAGLGIGLANQRLKEQQRSQAQSGLEGLTGLYTGASNNALGNVAANVQANNGAVKNSWAWASDVLAPVLQASSGSKWIAGG